jgi:hypothetical protein
MTFNIYIKSLSSVLIKSDLQHCHGPKKISPFVTIQLLNTYCYVPEHFGEKINLSDPQI